jgi:acetyl esterase
MEDGSLALGRGPQVARVEDLSFTANGHDLPVRVYRPVESPEPAGVVVYFHGGGWVIGSVATHDAYCRELAVASQCAVASVDYRLAPEHKFPTAAEDAYAAVQWIAQHAERLGFDRQRMAIAGDSAGGNLAAAAALMARDRGGPPIAFQLLIYPVVDCDFERSSYRNCSEGYLLTRASMIWFSQQYLPDIARASEPYASPMRAASLASLPPALVITAEYDPLCDEGEAYARRLHESGVEAKLSRYDGMIHGFARRTRLFDKARLALEEAAAAIRARVG